MNNKTALITGASSGIGRDMALILAERGYNLVLVARREKNLKALKALIKKNEKTKMVAVETIISDLSKVGAAKKVFAETKKLKIDIELLINNAGFGIFGNYIENDSAKVSEMLRLNIVALTELTSLYLPYMISQKNGYILQVSSIAAFQPTPSFSVYGATKAYVLSFGESLHVELKNSGVSVTTLYPGATKTEFQQIANHKSSAMSRMIEMNSHDVALASINAMFKRRASITTGAINKINALFIKFMPRKWATIIAGKAMSANQ